MFGRQRHKHNPGRFNLAITIQASSGERGTGGDFQRDWEGATMANRALRRNLTQLEVSMEGAMYSRATDVFEMPWVPDLTTDHRIEISGPRYFRIIAIRNLEERNRELYVYAVEDEGAKGAADY